MDNAAHIASPSYILPVEDQDLLMRDELRGVRFLLEYAKAELVLREKGVLSTIVVFGSARTPSPEQAERLLAEVSGAGPEAEVLRARISRGLARYEAARAFGRIASQRGGALAHPDQGRENVIATGGGPGVMEAANRGAREAGAVSIGFNITLPHEQEPNAYTDPALTFRFHYFAMRKMHLAIRANALVVFPGGFGTFDELFEILTLQQTRKAPPTPIVLVDRAYWTRAINLDVMLEEGVIASGDLDLFEIVDTAEEAWSALVRRGLRINPAPEAPGGTGAAV